MPTCAICGTDNPEGFRFCGQCGSALLEATPERRKTATLLFCDVSGSTALGERLETESVREMMLRYFDEMRVALERHSGVVEKFIGDAVMAVFGVPVAHEDDALRAVRAALDMLARLEELNEEFERRFGSRGGPRGGGNNRGVGQGGAGGGFPRRAAPGQGAPGGGVLFVGGGDPLGGGGGDRPPRGPPRQ